FSTSSFFAGVGTVVVTMALGFGGGVLLTGAFTGGEVRQPNKLERQAVDQSQIKPAAAPVPVIPKVPEPQIQAAVTAPATPSPAGVPPTPAPAAAPPTPA